MNKDYIEAQKQLNQVSRQLLDFSDMNNTASYLFDAIYQKKDSLILSALEKHLNKKITVAEINDLKHFFHVNRFPGHDDFFFKEKFFLRIMNINVKTTEENINVDLKFAYPEDIDHIPVPIK